MSITSSPDSATFPSLPTDTVGTIGDTPPVWRRIAALAIDWSIISAICEFGGLFATHQLAALGLWGRLVGGVIGVCYFGIGSSKLFGGQTIGNRFMGLVVRKLDGRYLSLPVALLRASVLMAFFTFGDMLPNNYSQATLIALRTLAAGVGGATLYLSIFNRHTGQLFHDLATRSIVKRSDSQALVVGEAEWRRHAPILIGIFTAAAFLSWIATAKGAGGVDEWSMARQSIREASAAARVVMVNDSANTSRQTWAGAHVTTYGVSPDKERLANTIAAIILRDSPVARGRDHIQITISCGYDILFAKSWRSQTWTYTPAEWGQRIRQQYKSPAAQLEVEAGAARRIGDYEHELPTTNSNHPSCVRNRLHLADLRRAG